MRTCFNVLVDCNYPLVVWRLDSTAQRGEETAVADRECTDEGQVPDYPESSHFRLPEQVVPLSWQKYQTRAWTTRVSHKSVPQECPTRKSRNSVAQECLTNLSLKSVPSECLTKVCHKSVLQECPQKCSMSCPTRVPQECPTGVSYKSEPKFPTRVSQKSVPQE